MTFVSSARELRDVAGIGIEEAKRIIKGAELGSDIDCAEDLNDLCDVLRRMVRDIYPEMPDGTCYMRGNDYEDIY